jgi:hypothetical protein
VQQGEVVEVQRLRIQGQDLLEHGNGLLELLLLEQALELLVEVAGLAARLARRQRRLLAGRCRGRGRLFLLSASRSRQGRVRG